MEDGTWRKGEPIFVSGAANTGTSGSSSSGSSSGGGSGSSSGSGSGNNNYNNNNNNNLRDIGNSYVFFFDIIEALMESMAVKQPELLSPYLRNLERCVLWAETNVAEEMLPNECDRETNR